MSQCWCSRVGKKERVFWVFFGLGVLGALIYEWVLAITDFVATPQRSRMSYQEMERLDLPNLLLCAHDPLNYSALRNVGVPDSGVSIFQQYLYPHLVVRIDGQSQPNQSSQVVDTLLKTYQGQRYKLLTDFHLKCEGAVAGCQLGSSPYLSPTECCQNATVKLLPFGACMLLSTPEQSTLGISGSYVVDLNIRTTDMRSQQGTNFEGFSVYLSESGRWPLNSAFNVLDNGVSYEVKLTPLFFRQTNWWKCDWNLQRFDSEYPYEYELMNCTSNAVMAECRCYPFQQLMFNSQDESQLCPNDINSINCMNRTLSVFTNYNQNLEKYLNDHYYRPNRICPSKIYPPCRWSKYQTSITQRKISTSPNAFASRLILYYESFDSLFIDQFYSPNYHDVVIQVGGALTFWFVVTLMCVLFVDFIKYLTGTNQVSANQEEQPSATAQNGSLFRSFRRKGKQQKQEDQEQGQIMEQQQQSPPPLPVPQQPPVSQLPPMTQSPMMPHQPQPMMLPQQGQVVQVMQMDANGQPQYHQVILPPHYQLGAMMHGQDLRLMAPPLLPPISSSGEVEQPAPAATW